MPEIVIKEYGFNETPGAPAPITLHHASPVTNLHLSDIGDTDTPADLQLSFQKAEHENTVAAYRIALFTGWTEPDPAEIEALSDDRYISGFLQAKIFRSRLHRMRWIF